MALTDERELLHLISDAFCTSMCTGTLALSLYAFKAGSQKWLEEMNVVDVCIQPDL